MKIIDRYLLRHFIAPFFFCMAVFIVLYVVIDLFENLSDMADAGVNLFFLLAYYLNFIPVVIVQIAPVSVLVAIMFCLGNFSRYNEITAMRSSGISLARILAPIIMAGSIISVSVFLINDKVVPDTTMNAAELKEGNMDLLKKEKTARKFGKAVENIAFYGLGDKIIYARSYKPVENELAGVIIHDQDEDQNVVSKTTAEHAHWKDNKWLGKNVMFFRLDKMGGIAGEPEFYNEAYLAIKETPVDFKKRRHQTEFTSYAELKGYIERLSFEKGATMRSLKVDLHQKIALPALSLIVVLIASPFALIHARKGGLMIGIGISICLVFAYYAVMSVSLAMGKAGFIPPLAAAWLANILFGAMGVASITRYK